MQQLLLIALNMNEARRSIATSGSPVVLAMVALLLIANTVPAAEDSEKLRAMLQANGHLGECRSCHGGNDPTRFKLDAGQSRLIIRADNFGYGPIVGEFREFDGGFKYDVDKGELLSIIASVTANSIDLGDSLLNAVVKERLLKTDEFPLLTFIAKEVERRDQGVTDVFGELTMLGVTRPIELQVTLNRSGEHPQDGEMTAGFSAQGSILRSDYGLTLGSPAVGDAISFEIVAIGSRAN